MQTCIERPNVRVPSIPDIGANLRIRPIADILRRCEIRSMIDVYESAVDHFGRYGAAFERNDETAFFYLLDLAREEDHQIIEAFNAHTVTEMPADAPVTLKWSAGDGAVGLFVDGDLLALFDLHTQGRMARWATASDRNLFVHH